MIDPLQIRFKIAGIKRKEVFQNTPVVSSGNLVEIYKSKFGQIPEALPEKVFSVSEDTTSTIMHNDYQLIDGVEMNMDWLHRKGEIENTYYIVDIGSAHLPGIGVLMQTYSTDCSFVLPNEDSRRFAETIKYWGKDYQEVKQSLGQVTSYATLIDPHRRYQLQEKHFPQPEELIKLGVKRVVLLIEAPIGEYDNHTKPDLQNILRKYRKAGLDFRCFGSDLRQGFKTTSLKLPPFLLRKSTEN